MIDVIKHDAILSIDDDGVVKKSTDVGACLIDRIQAYYQNSNRIDVGLGIPDRPFDPRTVEAIHKIHQEIVHLEEATGIRIGLASLTERPQKGMDRLREQYESVGIADYFDYWWGNPLGRVHTLHKPMVANELRLRGIPHGHIDDKFYVGRNLEQNGSLAYTRSTRITRLLLRRNSTSRMLLIEGSQYEKAGLDFCYAVLGEFKDGNLKNFTEENSPS